jgi:DNA-binding NtrC family response regulator
MMSIQVAVVDLTRRSCGHKTCAEFASLLQGHPWVDVTRATWPPSPESQPDCAVLRGCTPDVVSTSRRAWKNAKLFGVFCPSDTIADVARSVRQGLDDFVACPFDGHEFRCRFNRLLAIDSTDGRNSSAPRIPEGGDVGHIIGASEQLKAVLAKLPRIAESDVTCLLAGETGTGKELLARAIHYMSRRRGQAFLAINCGAVPDLLFENEFFGHAKGAYTDASTTQSGLLGLANRGTLFLDEVDALSLSAQVKLLRVLQDHEYRPLGAAQSMVADIRVLAATNADLRQCISQKSFREDLFHRLTVITITVPPLRDRRGDIPLLADHFLKKYARRHNRGSATLSPAALARLTTCDWRGNIRELEAAIERATILSSAALLQPEDFDILPADESRPDRVMTFQRAKQEAVRSFEVSFLRTILAAHGGNVTRAARASGKERRAFQRLLHKYALDRLNVHGETI